METKQANAALSESAQRLRNLARRCRDLSDMTAVPDVSHELTRIAKDLDQEAGRVESA